MKPTIQISIIPDAGHSAVKQKRPAVLCKPWGRGWIWFTLQRIISTKADQGAGSGVLKPSPLKITALTPTSSGPGVSWGREPEP